MTNIYHISAPRGDNKKALPRDTDNLVKTRYVFGILGLLGIAMVYALRVNLSVTIISMVKQTALSYTANDTLLNATCPVPEGGLPSGYPGDFDWDERRRMQMLQAFFWGYVAGQLPGGLLAERFGGKVVFGLGIFLTALLTLASPPLLWSDERFFLAARILEGVCESVTFPAIQLMIAKWSPPAERSRFSIIFSGSYVGTVLTMPLSGYLSGEGQGPWLGWPLVFYVTGAIALLWCIPWILLVFDSPAKHPRISEEERKYIEATLMGAHVKKKLTIPWKKLLRNPGLWACASMHFGIGWNFLGQSVYLPLYMNAILHYSSQNNGLLSAMPFVLGGVSSFVSTFTLHWLITRKKVRPLTGYKIFNGICGVGSAVTLVLLPQAGCDQVSINILLAINGICLGAQYAGNGTNLLAIASNFAGTMLGISNTVSNIGGIVSPYVVGYLTYENQTRAAWNTMFNVSSFVGVFTFVIYLAFCSDEEAAWNTPPSGG